MGTRALWGAGVTEGFDFRHMNSSSKWIENSDPGRLIVRVIARHDGQIIDQSGSRNLLVQWILGIWRSQPPPNVRYLLIEEQN